MKTKTRAFGALLIAAVLSLIVLYTTKWKLPNPSTATHVRFNAPFPAIDFAPFWVAKHKGWLEESLGRLGAVPHYQKPFNSIPLSLEALGSRTVDLVFTSGSVAVVGSAGGGDMRIAMLLCTLNSEVVISKAISARSMQALKGKRIATPSGSDSHYWFMRHLKDSGMSASEVEFKDLGPVDAVSALQGGQVDALAVFPPFSEFAILDGANVLPDVKSPIHVVMVASGEFLQQRPTLVAGVVQALVRAKQWILENSQEAQQIVAKETGQTLEVVNLAWPKIVWDAQLNDAVIQDLQWTADFLHKEKNTHPVDVRKQLLLQ